MSHWLYLLLFLPLCSLFVSFLPSTRPPSVGPLRDSFPMNSHVGRYVGIGPMPVSLGGRTQQWQQTEPFELIKQWIALHPMAWVAGVGNSSWLSPLTMLTKTWMYVSISSEEFFITMAVADLRYAGKAWIYLVKKGKAGEKGKKYSWSAISPFSYHIKRLKTSAKGKDSFDTCTTFSMGENEIKICWIPSENYYQVSGTASMKSEDGTSSFALSIGANIPLSPKQGFTLIYPLANDRIAYTFKDSVMPTTLRYLLRYDADISAHYIHSKQDMGEAPALCTVDYTRIQADRLTKWKWVSFTTKAKRGDREVVFGINLSDNLYNDNKGVSQENMIWVNSQLFVVGATKFEISEKGWHIISDSLPLIDIFFTPEGSHEEHVFTGLVNTDFVQHFGRFDGKVTVVSDVRSNEIIISDAYGVVEDHDARW